MSKTKKNKISTPLLASLLLAVTAVLLWSCAGKKNTAAASPPGYDINKPTKYGMPDALQEISGHAFANGDSKIVYAQQDEDGIVFRLPLGTKDETKTKFAGKGDYEDIAIAKGWVIMLKSNGTLYTFPISETKNEEAKGVIETKDLVPKAEYEGLYADEASGQIYLLCKTCKKDKGTTNASGYILSLQPNGSLKAAGEFTIDAGTVDGITGKKKGAFHPSALAKNPLTGEWFVVSSVNKVLLVTDSKWKIKGAYHLSSNIYNQPEGIAFDRDANLFISNEGSETQLGNILRFDYQAPKKK